MALLPKKTRGESVNLVLTLRYGDAENLKGLSTAADLLPDLMMRGTKELSRQQIQDALDKNLARLNLSGGAGTLSSSIETKRENLPAVLDLLRQVLREPTCRRTSSRSSRRSSWRGRRAARSRRRWRDSRWPRMLARYPKDDVRYLPTIEEGIERLKAARRSTS